jgi:NAD(P)-dependent dehydrogenase (short-subunit alcohol dehydrogenase family)
VALFCHFGAISILAARLLLRHSSPKAWEDRMGSLDGKVAIVTGAGQGVGAGIALALAKEGAAIVASGRTEETLRDVCGKIAAVGGPALAVTGDVMKPDDIARVVDRTLVEFGGIDILVNNAQIIHNHPLDEVDDRMFGEVFDSGPFATFRFMKAVRPHMTARGGGSIINLASSAPVRWDAKGFGVYSAAKQAIRSLSRAAAHEWARDGIRVNTIAPFASSPALDYWLEVDPEAAKATLATIPLGRIGDPERDIGRAVVFLVGPDAGYVTGLTMPLDGGQAYFG